MNFAVFIIGKGVLQQYIACRPSSASAISKPQKRHEALGLPVIGAEFDPHPLRAAQDRIGK